MGTTIRPELSEKNQYWIERHRYYELKHFCLQYPVWKKSYLALEGTIQRSQLENLTSSSKTHVTGDPTGNLAVARVFYRERMELIEHAARQTDPELGIYIFRAVTEELSYTYLKHTLQLPCGKDTYYRLYRKFFWILNKERK